MKWFQLDSTTPHDPRIRDVLLKMGNTGLGALLRLWCFVADQGRKRIGWSLDARGLPIPLSVVQDATGLDDENFRILLSTCANNGHIVRQQLERPEPVIVIPAMSKRGDTYTKRVKKRRVRTLIEHDAEKVSATSTSTSTKRSKYSGASAPREKSVQKNGKDPYGVVLKLTYGVLGRIPIKQSVEMASVKEDVKQQCAKYGIAYEGDVVGRAVESALAARAKVAVGKR